MALRKAGISLTLEGQAAYKAGLSEINREQRLLAQESKLAVAQLGTQASRQQTYTTQMDNYSKRIQVASDKTDVFKNRQKELPGIQTQLSKTLKDTNAAYQASVRETERLKNNYEQMKTALGSNNEATKAAKKAYQDSKAETKELGDEVKRLEKAYDSNEKELQNLPFSLSKAELATQQLRNEAQKLHEEYRNAGGRLADVSAKFTDMGDKLTHVGGTMQSMGRGMTTWITLPLMGVATMASKLGVNFEDAMAKVQATSGASGEELAQLEAKAREMGATTRFSASEAAEALYYMSLAGWNSQQMLSGLDGVMSLAAASGEDLGQVSDIVTDGLSAFGLQAEDSARMADVLAAAASNANTDVAGLGGAFKYVAPVAGALGFTMEDTSVAIGLMANSGIKAEKAGTALRTMMTNMASPTKAMKDAMKKLGISMTDSEGNMKSFDTIMKELRGTFDGLTEKQQAQYAATIFGKEAMSGALAIINASEEDYDKLTAAVQGSEGAAKSMAETMENTLGGKLRTLRSNTEELALSFFDSMYPALEGLVDKLQAGVTWLNSLSEETRGSIVQWGLFALAAGPVISMLGKITSGVGTLSGGMGELIKWFGKVTTPKLVGDMTTSFATIGGGATTTAAQVGGLSATIGGLPVVLGVAGAALLGWTAWKAWGEDAWNAAKRTREWGTDVGEATDKALTEIKGYSTSAIGQFSLLEDGFNGNTASMISNFEKMGAAIENDLVRQIDALKESIGMLPEEVRSTAQEIVDESTKAQEKALQVVQENNKRVAEIKQDAANNNREITAAEGKMIKSLMEESAAEYLKITVSDAESRKQIMSAMTGDVETASKEQALAWAKSLGEQRQNTKKEYNDQLEDYKKFLDDQGILNTEAGQKLVELFEQSKDASTDAIDAQLSLIAEKYPEIAEEIFLANGQTIDAMGDAGEAAKKQNQEIIKNAQEMSGQLAKSAEENAKLMSWVADESKLGAKTWNDIVLDEKTGEVKTNVREEVIKAGKDATTWNDMRFQLHNADLDSNAKSIIGEAALVNGWWDGMSWEEKAIILKDEFSQEIYQSLEKSGEWNKMKLEEKTAIMYSNTPEKMTETLAYLGRWEEFEPEIKEVNADNAGFIQSIRESEEKMNYWRSIPDETKEILGENYDLLTTIFQSEDAYNNFKALPDEEKRFLGENSDLMGVIFESQENYNRWLSLPEKDKRILGNNKDLMSKVLSSKQSYEEWMRMPDTLKKIRANTNVPGKAAESKKALDSVPLLKYAKINATTNAWEVANSAKQAIRSVQGKTVTVLTKFQSVGKPAGAGLEKGTNFHVGGPMIVNDQKGPLYKELVTFPNGKSFIPEGRNVFIPDAPRGTKVLKAALTKNLIPKYEKGVGFSDQSIRNLNSQTPVSIKIEVNDPVVREEQDINRLSDAIVDKLTLNTKLSNLFNKGKGGAYA